MLHYIHTYITNSASLNTSDLTICSYLSGHAMMRISANALNTYYTLTHYKHTLQILHTNITTSDCESQWYSLSLPTCACDYEEFCRVNSYALRLEYTQGQNNNALFAYRACVGPFHTQNAHCANRTITGRSCRLFIRSLSSKIKPCKWLINPTV